MLLGIESFDYTTTPSQLVGPWTSVSVASISAMAGRYSSGAALFNSATPSSMVKAIASTGTFNSGADRRVVGFAVKPTTISGVVTTPGKAFVVATSGAMTTVQRGITIARLTTPTYFYYLQILPNGALRVVQTTQAATSIGFTDMLAKTVGITAPGIVLAGQGFYVEWFVRLTIGAHGCIVKVNGGAVLDTSILAQTGTEDFTSVTLGGGMANLDSSGVWPATEVGTFYVDDFYVLDGVTTNIFSMNYLGPAGVTRTITNGSFLGNVHVQGLLATADAFNLPNPGNDYVPWTPNSGSTHYTQVDEHPPDGDTTYEYSDALGTYNVGLHRLDKYAGYLFQHPNRGKSSFGIRISGGGYYQLFGVRWLANIRIESSSGTIKPTMRMIFSNLAAVDPVGLGTVQTISSTSYGYKEQYWDRKPDPIQTVGSIEWTFEDTFVTGALGSTSGISEFGVTRVS